MNTTQRITFMLKRRRWFMRVYQDRHYYCQNWFYISFVDGVETRRLPFHTQYEAERLFDQVIDWAYKHGAITPGV